MSWKEALHEVAPTVARYSAAFSVALVALIASTAPFSSMESLITLSFDGFLLLVLSSGYAALISVAREVLASKQQIRRHQLESALKQISAPNAQPSVLTRRERAGRFGRDFKPTIAAMMGFVIGVGQGVVRDAIEAWTAGTFDPAWAALVALAFLPLPLYLAAMFWRESRRSSTSDVMERTERAFTEATRDRAQLAGGLVLDEHAHRAQEGGLTVQVHAGGMELNEEVTLDLDSSAEGVAKHVAESHQESRKP